MVTKMAPTRQDDSLFLLGVRDLDPLTKSIQLPSMRQVLLRFHHHLNELKSVRKAAQITVEELNMEFS